MKMKWFRFLALTVAAVLLFCGFSVMADDRDPMDKIKPQLASYLQNEEYEGSIFHVYIDLTNKPDFQQIVYDGRYDEILKTDFRLIEDPDAYFLELNQSFITDAMALEKAYLKMMAIELGIEDKARPINLVYFPADLTKEEILRLAEDDRVMGLDGRIPRLLDYDPAQQVDLCYDFTASDALVILQYTVGILDEFDADAPDYDLNGDGKINSVDALMALQHSVGLIRLQVLRPLPDGVVLPPNLFPSVTAP